MDLSKNEEIRLEIRRKSTHIILGTLIILAAWIFEPILGKLVVLPVFAAVVFVLILQKRRFRGHFLNRFLLSFERKKEEKILYQGALFYGIGIVLPLFFLEIRPACSVIAILTFGDGTSTIIGKWFGRHKFLGKKSLEGTLSFILISIPAAFFFVQSLPLAVGLSLAGAAIELFAPFDDNLAIPLLLTAVYLLVL